MAKQYTASLSRSQNREGWSVIFRHPVRIDKATGQPGLRVRQGLGTKRQEEAEVLVGQMNELLGNPIYWDLGSRETAAAKYDERIVEIFYYKLTPELNDFRLLRDAALPLPTSEEGYRRLLLVGTTGSGKTTVARQLLGTNPKTERFPSTSTGKTTVSDMEMILAPGAFRAVVTFIPYAQVLDYVQDCVSAAAFACARKDGNMSVVRHLLNHVSQRFRLSYVFGNGPYVEHSMDFDDDDEDAATEDGASDETPVDLSGINQQIAKWVEILRTVAISLSDELRLELHPDKSDERVFEEIFEEELDFRLREDENCQALVDEIMDSIGERYELQTTGRIVKNRQGWPELWEWETENRKNFLSQLARFTSNHAKYFGELLSPLVNGIRVAGPFQPSWVAEQPKLVIIDGEGLGHTPDSSASIPTALTRRFDDSDAILLVDNAAQPMQVAPVTLMKSLASAGQTSKLMICFTHMDQVKGVNIPNFELRKQHVLASAENVLTSIGEQLGKYAERALRQSIDSGCFFVGGIDRKLDSEAKADKRSIGQMISLLTRVTAPNNAPDLVSSRPVYDRVNLVLAVKNATEKFHEGWAFRLGFQSKADAPKEHWTRIKALTRRLALGWSDEYDNLKPVADLHKNLQDGVYVFIQSPMKWEGPEPNDDQKQAIFSRFAEEVSLRSLGIVSQRIRQERAEEWQDAYNCRGIGSSFSRAEIIDHDIYDRAAPIPDVAPSPDRNRFLHEVMEAVSDAAAVLEIKLV